MSWLSGWAYRRAITITEQSGSTLTDYQVRIDLNSSNFDFSKANADGRDIRFTADDGETLLSYYIEKWDDVNEEAIIWVKVPSIPANGSVTIYMYYGNPSAVSESDGEAVFEFFDDFEGTSLDTNKWTNNGATLTFGSGYVNIAGGNIISSTTYLYPVALRTRFRMNEGGAGTTGNSKIIGFRTSAGDKSAAYWWSSGSDTYYAGAKNEGASTNVEVSELNAWVTGEIVWPDTTKVDFYLDDVLEATITTNVPDEAIPIQLYSDGQGSLDVDFVAIRKYAEQEPTATVGSEEMPIKAWDGSQWKDIKAIYYWNGSSWVKAKGAYYWDGSQWVQFWVGPPPPFGTVLRSASKYLVGIGGDSTVIWGCNDSSTVYELSTTDLSVVRSASSPSTNPYGIGGDPTVIWHSDWGVDRVYELSTTDFSVVRSANSPYTYPYGIGGDSSVIWHCDNGNHYVYELSTTDFSVVRWGHAPGNGTTGIGGDPTVIWYCDYGVGRVYELSTTDFSVVRSASSPSTNPRGIGGKYNVIWHCDASTSKVYELSTG